MIKRNMCIACTCSDRVPIIIVISSGTCIISMSTSISFSIITNILLLLLIIIIIIIGRLQSIPHINIACSYFNVEIEIRSGNILQALLSFMGGVMKGVTGASITVTFSRTSIHSKANLRTKVTDFSGFDSSGVLILRGGILKSIGSFPQNAESTHLSRREYQREIGRTEFSSQGFGESRCRTSQSVQRAVSASSSPFSPRMRSRFSRMQLFVRSSGSCCFTQSVACLLGLFSLFVAVCAYLPCWYLSLSLYIYIYIYVYIYIERERDLSIDLSIYLYIYIYTHIQYVYICVYIYIYR